MTLYSRYLVPFVQWHSYAVDFLMSFTAHDAIIDWAGVGV
jgi:hypothetical protein